MQIENRTILKEYTCLLAGIDKALFDAYKEGHINLERLKLYRKHMSIYMQGYEKLSNIMGLPYALYLILKFCPIKKIRNQIANASLLCSQLLRNLMQIRISIRDKRFNELNKIFGETNLN